MRASRPAPACDQRTAFAIHVAMRMDVQSDLGGAPRLQPTGEIAMGVVEERPLQKTAVDHHRPSNTGRVFAANAS